MRQWFTDNFFTIVTVVVGPVLGWTLSKKLFQKRELSILDASVMEKNLALYQDMLDDVVARKDKEIAGLVEDIEELNTIITNLKNDGARSREHRYTSQEK